jgi:hypothetical protein
MIISEQELQRRLGSSKNLLNTIPRSSQALYSTEIKVPPGDAVAPLEGQSSLPLLADKPAGLACESLKTIAASLVRQGVPEATVCREFNIPAHEVRTADEAKVSASIARVRELALDRLLITLGLMTPDMLASASLKELSTNTANLSRVLDKTAPKEINDNRVQFLVYAPGVRTLGSYPTVDV